MIKNPRIEPAMSRLLRIVLPACVLLSLAACSRKDGADEAFPPMRFRVDSTRIGSPLVVDGAFSLRAPVNWLPVDSTTFEEAKRIVDSDTSAPLPLELLHIFASEEGASCGISRVLSDANVFDLLDANYEGRLAQSLGSQGVARAAFTINGIRTVQFRIIGEDILAFKLFVEIGRQSYQIDYMIPKRVYPSEILNVESSIGSISKALIGERSTLQEG